MAIIYQGILGAFSGKCGGVIGYVRNGVACVRSMPAHYRDRKSAAQLRNRGRFTMVMKAMSVVRPVVKLGFGRFATEMKEMNVATRENYYRLVRDGASGMEYAWEGMVLSRGAVEPLVGVMCVAQGVSVSLNWNGQDVRGGGEDEVTVVMVNSERMEMRMKRGVAHRGNGCATVALPGGWGAEEVWCYVMVERDGEWSDSMCVGCVSGQGGVCLAAENGKLRVDHGIGDGKKVDVAEDQCLKDGEDLGSCLDQSAIRMLPESGLNGDGLVAERRARGDDGVPEGQER